MSSKIDRLVVLEFLFHSTTYLAFFYCIVNCSFCIGVARAVRGSAVGLGTYRGKGSQVRQEQEIADLIRLSV